MNDIQELVNGRLSNYIESGKLQDAIDKKLEKTIEDVLDSALRSWSDFGKELTKKIEEQLGASARRITLPEYNKYIADLVGELYTKTLHKQAEEHLLPLLQEALEPVPAEVTANELLQQIAKHWQDDVIQNGHEEIEIEWSRSDNAIYATFKHPEYDWYNTKVSFYNHGGAPAHEIGYISEDEKSMRRGPEAHSHSYGAAGYLFKLYCRNTQITGLEKVYGESIYLETDY